MYLFFYLFIYSFIYLFIYLFIYSFLLYIFTANFINQYLLNNKNILQQRSGTLISLELLLQLKKQQKHLKVYCPLLMILSKCGFFQEKVCPPPFTNNF